MADRREWDHATAHSRRLAVTADAELRRRHPEQKIEPLRPAEPAPVRDADRQHPDLVSRHKTGDTAWIRDLAVQRQAFRTAMTERGSSPVPVEDLASSGLGEPRSAREPPWRDAILQPPKPQIPPSGKILQLAAEHDIEPEAAS